ncbi:hypothetical protein A4D02_17095 [Niastella koreensis]|uniref:Uncharacterized protein n=2 Tax=Niastella koreensis TaxID=354356 RepID=G8TE83_NIAKG|nr:hypothetical protein [Niastella koreensis]AEV97274.1 hypothetical protein Niako_0895 [Niastella koreensis GR20-10]OQP39054.1 hypothetical protein A4D02_17095 [Niastella koreensis]
MQRKDLYLVGILWLLLLFIFLPLFYSSFIFMDEAFQLWGYRAVPGFYMFIDEGRYLTEILQRWLFNMIDTIDGVKYMRLFSLFGWMLCLPLWYAIIKKEVANVPQYKYLPFFTCLYLITNPSFLVAVQWATCLQFFISDTASLLAGALVINSLRSDEFKLGKVVWAAVLALLLGVPAMFLYQGSWACFLIPFLLHFVNPMNFKKDRVLIGGMAVHFFVYAAYFVAYKISFHLLVNIPEDPRNGLYINPIEKIAFFLARPLERSFRFTLLTEERSQISFVYYALALLTLAVLTFIRFGKAKWLQAVKFLAVIGIFWVVSYLPGLLIRERFASNRTLMALNMCVFIVCFEMALYYIKNQRVLQIGAVAIFLFFVSCARFNLNQGFVKPLVAETAALKNYFKEHYNRNIQTVHWIRPPEDELANKFHVNYSMDEFGMPNSYFVWVPENLSKQLVYEQTGDRIAGHNLVVKQWASKEEYLKSGEKADSTVLVVDNKEIIDDIKP